MDEKVNHALVGAFVLVLGALLVAGVLWLSAGLGRQAKLDVYQGVIQESVAGLNVDAPVKVLGVDVGKVTRIEIDRQNSEQVRLHFLIEQGTPIKQDSVAVLKTQGLTGIAYVELSGGSAEAALLVRGPDGRPPTIPFKLSLTARLENVLTAVLGNVDRVSNNLNAVFDDQNRAALKSTLADTAILARTLAAQQGALSAGIADAARSARVVAQAVEQLEPTLNRIAASAQAVERMAQTAEGASGRAGVAADAAASGVQQLRGETLPELARLMAEMNQLAVSLRHLTDQTAGNPSSLLVGKAPPRPGPGEGGSR